MSEKVTIKIPKPLYESLKKIIEGTGYSSVTEFVIFVLRDLVSSNEPEDYKENIEEFTEEELEIIKQRLRNLGYID
ncbi:ribbon-helix-helix domain-containing protein [Marinitoga sp. 38H-ov]|uniref:ribbon-helix-helix domain-containing protein n=1 Tax=Marinitoga sp. 38H-ov TaxID=1755814 RepID=UPI0013EAC179|nr:ribbon-helix-helix domain-containing protein [Marinitoga sp. 38H-ov]KAF2956272.1 CopG family transcriptional regulator [Marinitoga sp. 38H-ov]